MPALERVELAVPDVVDQQNVRYEGTDRKAQDEGAQGKRLRDNSPAERSAERWDGLNVVDAGHGDDAEHEEEHGIGDAEPRQRVGAHRIAQARNDAD